jgi:uncharacterized protein (DUF1778 family)
MKAKAAAKSAAAKAFLAPRAKPVAKVPRKAASESNISMRISSSTLEMISSAAATEGKTRTEFMLDSARRRATEVLVEQRLFVLNDEQHAAFMRVLDSPPAPSANLRRLMSTPSPWEK